MSTLEAILVAVIVSLLALAYQEYNPRVHVLGRKRGTNVFRPRSAEHPDDESWPGLLIVRPEGRVFFGNAERVVEKIWALAGDAGAKTVVVDGRAVPELEYTALKMLTAAEEKLRRGGVALWLVGLNPSVLNVVQRSQLGATLGRERMFFNLQAAIERYTQAGLAKAGAVGAKAQVSSADSNNTDDWS